MFVEYELWVFVALTWAVIGVLFYLIRGWILALQDQITALQADVDGLAVEVIAAVADKLTKANSRRCRKAGE